MRYDLEKVPTAAGTYEANGLEPRLFGAVQLGKNRDTVLRGGYGHATIFAPLFQIEAIYKPPVAVQQRPGDLADLRWDGRELQRTVPELLRRTV